MRIVVLDDQNSTQNSWSSKLFVDNLRLLGNKMNMYSRANPKILQSCFNTLYSCNDGAIVARNRERKWGWVVLICKLEKLEYIIYREGEM